jgi:mono/diheme cytochrome c family protein
MTFKRTVIVVLIALIGLLALLRLAGTIALAAAALTPASGVDGQRFDAKLIARGRKLAAVGNCAACHSAPGGAALAGGLALHTPFGVIYSDNITPDPRDGIGSWSQADFDRAMREGIAPNGEHLYPAFPYDYFARMQQGDLDALYAYLMTRTPVAQKKPANRLDFPFNQRVLLAGWNLLFLSPKPITTDPNHSRAWNRGRYLVQSLAHCGACHSPRNWLQGSVEGESLSGGVAEGWTAPALNHTSPAPVLWTQEELETYLRTGIDAHHGAAAGPMLAVTNSLRRAAPHDIQAIAVYLASLMPAAPPSHAPYAPTKKMATAAAIVHGVCASCHGLNAPIADDRWPPLEASTALQENSARNTIQILMNGLPLPNTRSAPFMPGFSHILTDAQIADVVRYLREHVVHRKPWSDVRELVHRIRAETPATP